MSRSKIVWTERVIIQNSVGIPAIYIIIREKFPNIRVYGRSVFSTVVNECVHNGIKMLLQSGIYFPGKFSLDSRRKSRNLTYIRTMTLACESSREKARCMLKTTETRNDRSHFWPVFVAFPLGFCIDVSFFYKEVLSLVDWKTYRRPYARVFILKLPVAIIIWSSTRLERRYSRRTISQTDRQAKVVSVEESNQNRSANSINNRDKPWKE